MDYLDYAYELNKLDNKFESEREVLQLVKELRSILMNNENDKILDITFRALELVDVVDKNLHYSDEDLDDEYEKGYRKGYSDAICQAVSSIEDLSPY